MRFYVGIAALSALLALSGCQTIEKSPSAAATNSVLPVGIYLAQTEPGRDLVAVATPGGMLYLQNAPLLVRTDITDAAALQNDAGEPYVGLRLGPEGSQRLSTASRLSSHSLLAVIVGRELVAAPAMGAPLDRGVISFTVKSAAAASEIAARIRGETM